MRLGLRRQNVSKYVRQKGHDIHCSPHLARDVATLPGHDRNWQNSSMYISSSTWWMIANPWQQYPSRRWHAPACIGSTQARKLKLCKVRCRGTRGKVWALERALALHPGDLPSYENKVWKDMKSIQKPARHKEPENKAWCTEAQEAQKLLTFHEAFWIHLLGQGRSNLPWLASWPQGCTSFASSILQP